LDDLDQVLELALEILRFGEHREAVGAGRGVGAGLGHGVHAFADLTDARGGSLHFGD
jgi:hypothetical protein